MSHCKLAPDEILIMRRITYIYIYLHRTADREADPVCLGNGWEIEIIAGRCCRTQSTDRLCLPPSRPTYIYMCVCVYRTTINRYTQRLFPFSSSSFSLKPSQWVNHSLRCGQIGSKNRKPIGKQKQNKEEPREYIYIYWWPKKKEKREEQACCLDDGYL